VDIITFATYVHDSVYCRMIDDNEEQEEEDQECCHTQLNLCLQLFNSIVFACYFFFRLYLMLFRL